MKPWKLRHWVTGLGLCTFLLGIGSLHYVYADGIYTPKAVLPQQVDERLQVRYQGDTSEAADLYLATLLQQQLLFFTGQGVSLEAMPILRQEGFIPDRTLLDIAVDNIPAGRYQVYQVLVKAGGDVFNFADWIGGLSTLNFIVGENSVSSRDYDGDGFADDDHDHDGYHDNDHDRDGYDDNERDDEYDEHDDHDDEYYNDTPSPNTAPAPPTPPASNLYPDGARLLAAQCAQCHGTEGVSITGIDSLREESDEIAEEMFEMKYSNDLNDIMHRHAMGYSDEEIRKIDAYFRALYGRP